MFLYFEKELGWTELIKRTVKDSIQDDIAGIAAQLSYYFFLSLFPALLFLVALASFFPLYNFNDELVRLYERLVAQPFTAQPAMPHAVGAAVRGRP